MGKSKSVTVRHKLNLDVTLEMEYRGGHLIWAAYDQNDEELGSGSAGLDTTEEQIARDITDELVLVPPLKRETVHRMLNKIRDARLAKVTKSKRGSTTKSKAKKTPKLLLERLQTPHDASPGAAIYGSRPGTQAAAYKTAIMRAPKLSDEALHKAVGVALGGAKMAGPLSYVGWYRNWLKKHGHLR